MWDAELIAQRDVMLARQAELQGLPGRVPGTYLHLGCGPNILEGFENIDKYVKHPQIQNYDMFELPHKEGTVNAIYSSHSLEHLPFRQARKALREWHRVMAPGGTLFLAVPDVELCFQAMLRPDVSFESKWQWFVYTIWGFQADPTYTDKNLSLDLPVEPGQFHTCGFTKEFLRRELETIGWNIKTLFSYDGWMTPSIWMEAQK